MMNVVNPANARVAFPAVVVIQPLSPTPMLPPAPQPAQQLQPAAGRHLEVLA